MRSRSYTILGAFLGTSDESTLDAWDDSFLYYCVGCGKVVGTAEVEGQQLRSRRWEARSVCCEDCRPPEPFYNWVPGSIWSYEEKRNDYLPFEVLRRELLLTIKAMEGEENGRKSGSESYAE